MNTQLENTKSTTRIAYIDVLKFIAIYLVFVGHMGRTYLNSYIWSFHMPLFFFVSGMLLKNNKSSLLESILHKFKAYMIPYYFFAALATLVVVLDKNKSLTQISVSLSDIGHYVQSFLYASRNGLPFAGSLWFLPALFLLSILMYFYTL